MNIAGPLSDFAGIATVPLKERNTLADWIFYDVSNLTSPEFDMLVRETNLEGAILVVEPRGSDDSIHVQKFDDFMSFRREPGDLLQHFSIAGVGSSDVGAASLARTLANHLDAPVGAIVAGYGVSDLLAEAMGGWFFFGAANRFRSAMLSLRPPGPVASGMHDGAPADATGMPPVMMRYQTDTQTLLRLLTEPERQIETLLGHSKGCLSIAFALNLLGELPDRSHSQRARDIDVITTGAVVAFPGNMGRVRQYLGAIDWFGAINSSLRLPFIAVPHAWHHVNSEIQMHMNVARVLAGEYD